MLLNLPRAQRVMDRHNLTGLVAAAALNIRYVSDFDGLTMRAWNERVFAVLPRDSNKPASLVMGGVEVPRLARYPSWMRVRIYGRTGSSTTAWAQAAEGASFTEMERLWEALEDDVESASATAIEAVRLAIEEGGMARGRVGFDDLRVAGYLQNAAGMSALQPIEGRNIFREIRMIKTVPEIEIMRKAAKLNEAAAMRAVNTMRPTRSWPEVEDAWASDLCAHGGRPVYLACGTHEGRFRTLPAGEPITLDGLGSYQGYHADIGRTIVIGQPAWDLRKKYEALRGGFMQIYPQLKAGMTSEDITNRVIQNVRGAGLPLFSIVSPHSIGLEHTDHPHPLGGEPPSAHLPWVMEPNMTFNIDMPYLERGWGTMHLEDTLLSTETGVEPLTSLKTDLVCV